MYGLNRWEVGHLQDELSLLYVVTYQHTDYLAVVDEVQHRSSVILEHPLAELRSLEMHIHEGLQV